MTIGQRIQKARKEKGLTQKELAAKLELATGTIQQYELDKRQPRLEQIQKIAGALGISKYELLGEEFDLFFFKNSLAYSVENNPEMPSRERLKFLFDNLDYDPMIIACNLEIDQTYIDTWLNYGDLPPQPIIDKILGVFQMKPSELLNTEELVAYHAEDREWGKDPWPFTQISAALNKLNEEGQQKAVSYVEDLAGHPDYRRQPPPSDGPAEAIEDE